mgnify:CR=1 FL=1
MLVEGMDNLDILKLILQDKIDWNDLDEDQLLAVQLELMAQIAEHRAEEIGSPMVWEPSSCYH